MAAKGDRLTAKQKRFVEEYAADGNAVQAYFRAFGRLTSKGKRRSYKAAQSSSSLLLSNPIIAAEIGVANDVHAKRVRVSKQRVMRELAALAFSDPADLYEPDPANGNLPTPRPWDEVPPAARKAIQSVKIKRRRLAGGGGKDDTTEWEIEEVEYRLTPKGPELDKLCKKLGFYEDAKGDDPDAPPAVIEVPSNGRG